MAKFELDIVSNIEKVKWAFKEAPEDTVKHIQRAIELIAFRLERVAKPKVNVDTGALRDDTKVQEIRPLYARVGSNKSYSVFVHEGTKPHFPPVDKLSGWARRHGIDPFLVAKSISKKGTKANPFLRDAIEETGDYRDKTFIRELETVLQSIESRSK